MQSPYARYTVLNLIGRGGMGAVYRVQRADDKSIWALKEMRPPPDVPPEEVAENRKLFNQEADLLQIDFRWQGYWERKTANLRLLLAEEKYMAMQGGSRMPPLLATCQAPRCGVIVESCAGRLSKPATRPE